MKVQAGDRVKLAGETYKTRKVDEVHEDGSVTCRGGHVFRADEILDVYRDSVAEEFKQDKYKYPHQLKHKGK